MRICTEPHLLASAQAYMNACMHRRTQKHASIRAETWQVTQIFTRLTQGTGLAGSPEGGGNAAGASGGGEEAVGKVIGGGDAAGGGGEITASTRITISLKTCCLATMLVFMPTCTCTGMRTRTQRDKLRQMFLQEIFLCTVNKQAHQEEEGLQVGAEEKQQEEEEMR